MAAILNDLGMISRDLGHNSQSKNNKNDNTDFVNALHYLNQAIELSTKLSNQGKNMVRYLTNLGEIYRCLGNLTEAETTIQGALKIAQVEFKDQKHRLISSAYYNLGNVYMDRKEYAEAKRCFEKAVTISTDESIAGKNHPLSARHIDALGLAWKALGHENEACHFFQEAFNIIESDKPGRGQAQLRELILNHKNTCQKFLTVHAPSMNAQFWAPWRARIVTLEKS